MRVKTSHIVLGSVVSTLVLSGSAFAVEVCRPAEVLHTAECTNTYNNDYCRALGYYVGGSKNTTTMTYGSLPTESEFSFGDAYDCDVNGDGDFDAENERFYYLANYGDYASLIWSKDSGNTKKYTDTNNDSKHLVPYNSSANLPTTWNNVSLKNSTRAIRLVDSTGAITDTVNYYTYTSTSRIMSLKDLELGLGSAIQDSLLARKKGVLDNYIFLFESSRFEVGNKGVMGFWLEEPKDLICNASYNQTCSLTLTGQTRSLDQSQWSTSDKFSFRPVIEVSFADISNYELFDIEYELNGGVLEKENPDSYRIVDEITLNNPIKQGYVFEGWATDIGGADAVNPLTIPTGSYGDKKFYAIFSPAIDTPYIVKHLRKDINGTYSIEEDEFGTGVTATTIRPATKTYDGYTSPALQDLYIKADGTAELEYKYEPIEYTISYNLDGGSVAGENPENYYIYNSYTLINPTKQGYVFAGWKINGTGEARMDISVTPGQFGDILYLATWSNALNTPYSVVHCRETLSGEYDDCEIESLTGETNSEVIPDRKSYSGYLSPNGRSMRITADGLASLTYEYNLIDYDIDYNLDGGVVDGKNPDTYNILSDEIRLINPTKIGYGFNGWMLDGRSGTYIEEIIPTNSFGNRVYTASWLPSANTEYHVLHKVQDAQGVYRLNEDEKLTGTTGEEVTPDTKEYDGHKAPAKQSFNIAADGSSSIEYRYDLIHYSLRYELNGGVVDGENPDSYTIYDSFELIEPTREDYDFAGWTVGGAAVEGKIAAGTMGDKIFIANWNDASEPDDPDAPDTPDTPDEPDVSGEDSGSPDTTDVVLEFVGVGLLGVTILLLFAGASICGRRFYKN